MQSLHECQFKECSVPVDNGNDFCNLHARNSNRLCTQRFKEDLIAYIVIQIFSNRQKNSNFDEVSVKNALLYQPNSVIKQELEQTQLHLYGIQFPSNTDSHSSNYLQILRLFHDLHFHKCSFHDTGIELGGQKVLFQDCTFHNSWLVDNHALLPNAESALYVRCQFNKDVNILGKPERLFVIESSLFSDCRFDRSLTLNNSHFKSPLFRNTSIAQRFFIKGALSVIACNFDDRFCLNNYKINELIFEKSRFKAKVELKNNEISSAKIEDCNFFQLFDCYRSKFGSFNIDKCIFEGIAVLDGCSFGDMRKRASAPTSFSHSTFNEAINFRKAKFFSGLDISTINFNKFPNFFDAEVKPENTNRETFRIIKHSFDNVGNFIEGNRFFAKEMKKYRKDLQKNGTLQEKLIFLFNHRISDFGQNYIWPLGWLALSLLLYSLIIYGYHQNWLYGVSPGWDRFWSMTSSFLNTLANNLLPVQRFLKEGLEFVSLLFYVIFIILIWQIVIAVKRKVKR